MLKRVDEEGTASGYSREKVVVFIVAFILAFCMWLLVNLSRDFSLNLNLQVNVGNMPEDRALVEQLPEYATVSVQGEGWKLINLYNNPPQLYVDVQQEEINLYDQVRQQMNVMPDITVQKVQPLILNVELQEKISKTVPVVPSFEVEFRERFDYEGERRITPDSVTVTAARSVIDTVTSWPTRPVVLEDVRGDIDRTIALMEPHPLINLSTNQVQLTAPVAEFTEGETRVFIQTRNLPRGRTVNYSPSYITVRYDVPIDEYNQVKDLTPYNAYVTYEQIQQDTTGFVTPQVDQVVDQYYLKLRTFQPQEVAYFNVVEE